jgi:hypothetical protein
MKRAAKPALLAILLVVLAVVVYRRLWPVDAASSPAVATQTFVPLPVENPALRLDLLERLQQYSYQASRRNIFSAAAPSPERTVTIAPPVTQQPPRQQAPPPSPPLTVPATFFGYVTDARTGHKRAFFSEGEEVHVVAIGEVLMGRFRLLQIGNSTAEVEETSSGRRTTLTMEEPRS